MKFKFRYLSRLIGTGFIVFFGQYAHCAATPLSELKHPDARAVYCKHVTGMQMGILITRNKVAEGMQMIKRVQEWQDEIKRLYPDKGKLVLHSTEAMSKLAKHTDARMKATSEARQKAESYYSDQDIAACNTELVAYKKRTLDKPAALAIKQQQSTAPMILLMRIKRPEVKLLDQAVFALWDTQRGVREGVAVLTKDDKRCFARITLTTKYVKKISSSFKPIEGEACGLFKGGLFKYFNQDSHSNNVTWFPDDYKVTTIENIIQHRKTHEISLTPVDVTPDYMKAHIARYKTIEQLADEKTPEQLAHYNKVLGQTRAALGKPSRSDFSEADLIGVWKGEFVNKRNLYPAQLAFWSANVDEFQRLRGVVVFDDPICPLGIEVNKHKENVWFSLTRGMISMPDSKCVMSEGRGVMQFLQSDGILNLYLQASGEAKDKRGMRPKDCLADLPRQGCYSPGTFTRAKAGMHLNEIMKVARWPYSAPPGDKTWAIIKDNKPVPASIKQQHETLMANNAEVWKAIERRKEAFDRYLKAQYAAEDAKEKQKKENAQRAKKRGAMQWLKKGDRYTRPKVVKGPFDGLEGSSFFNAIYHADFASVRQQSRYYQATKYQQIKTFMGTYNDEFSDGFIRGIYQNVDMMNIFYALYLKKYQDDYKSCLRRDAIKFELKETTEGSPVLDWKGNEIGRKEPVVTLTYYTVNKEFSAIFERIGKIKPNNVSAGFLDLLVGGGGINMPSQLANADPGLGQLSTLLRGRGERDIRNQVVSGTSRLMKKFPCDSPEIKQLEDNMILYNGS